MGTSSFTEALTARKSSSRSFRAIIAVEAALAMVKMKKNGGRSLINLDAVIPPAISPTPEASPKLSPTTSNSNWHTNGSPWATSKAAEWDLSIYETLDPSEGDATHFYARPI